MTNARCLNPAVYAPFTTFYGLVVLLDFKEVDTTAKLDARTCWRSLKMALAGVS